MASKKKLLQAAAGSAGGAGLDVDEVFSTYLWDGNGSSQTIVNGIDLDGEGGLVWYKGRDTGGLGASQRHSLYDTERGATKRLRSDSTSAAQTESTALTAFNSNGFTIGGDAETNQSNYDYASWTFRKAPKFFDVVSIDVPDPEPTTITVNHNLGQQVGMVIIKPYLHTYPWYVWHRSIGANNNLELNTTAAQSSFGGTGFSSTSTTITIRGFFGHSGSSNGKCILYLFAHNDGDGDFGPDGDADVIKCGSYTGNGSSTGPVVNLGFEPQWIMIKKANSSQNANWYMFDTMRGIVTGGDDPYLYANTSAAEVAGNVLEVTPTGFQLKTSANGFNGSGDEYIFMAIRRGPLAAPDDATKVFSPNLATGFPRYATGFVTDFTIQSARDSGSKANYTRLTGTNAMRTTSTAAEFSSAWDWAQMTGSGPNFSSTNYIGWNWKRAPSYFDVVGYVGAGAAQTVNHNLGVVPEMMWIKNRDSAENWAVYHSALGTSKYLHLNTTDAASTTDAANRWNNTSPTATQFSVGTSTEVSHFTRDFIAYLFATVAGVSKVGSYTGTGSSGNDVDCGFTSGARFVLIRRVNGDEWVVFDTARGITSANNDPKLSLNGTGAENSSSSRDLDPLSSGFTVNGADTSMNASGDTYIFYAIA